MSQVAGSHEAIDRKICLFTDMLTLQTWAISKQNFIA